MVQRYEFTISYKTVGPKEHAEGRFVTYEDYQKLEAELEALRQQLAAPEDDGWIEWGGGECSLSKWCRVDVILRSGEDISGGVAAFWDWSHRAMPSDIIAYRVLK